MSTTTAAERTGTVAPVEQVADAARCLERLTRVDWDQVTVEDLPGTAVDLARIRSQAEAALVVVAERVAATDAAAAHGWASAKDFLTHITGGRKGTGGSLLRLAAHTAELPEVRHALVTGTISTAQARSIGARVATLPRAGDLREQASSRLLELVVLEHYDATDLDHAFTNVVRELDPDGTLLRADLDKEKAERGAHHARHLSFAHDAVGGVRIKGYATIEDAELVKATLMPLTAPVSTEPGACGGDPDAVGPRGRGQEDGRRAGSGCPDPTCSHDGTDPRDGGTRLLDALVETCRRLQASDTVPHDHATASRITVTIPYEALREQIAATGAAPEDGLLPSGASLSAAAVRRLACDAEILPAVLGTEGQILDVGRTQRLITTAIWLALCLRDQHCAFPGCTRLPIACDAHHIIHWANGGPTSLDNLVMLCRRHHTLTHQTPWQVHLDPHTRRPIWTPPPATDDRARFTYLSARPPPDRASQVA